MSFFVFVFYTGCTCSLESPKMSNRQQSLDFQSSRRMIDLFSIKLVIRPFLYVFIFEFVGPTKSETDKSHPLAWGKIEKLVGNSQAMLHGD